MRNHSVLRLLVRWLSVTGLMWLCLPVWGQESSPTQLLAAKQYPAYVALLPDALTSGQPTGVIPFERLVGAAIALDKTKGWDGEHAKQLRELLGKTPTSLAQFDALRTILKGDVTGFTALFKDATTQPHPFSCHQAASLLQQHEFPVAADALTMLVPERPEHCLVAWSHLPTEARTVIEPIFEARYPVKSSTRQLFVITAFEFLRTPRKEIDVSPARCVEFGLRFGKDSGIISLALAQSLLQSGKRAEAIQVVLAVIQAAPTDRMLARRGLELVRMTGDHTATLALYQQLVKSTPSPEVRVIRLEYLQYLLYLQYLAKSTPNLPAFPSMKELEHDADPLVAGDAYLVERKIPDATKCYRTAQTDPNHLVEAWSGMLDSDPGAALTMGGTVIDTLMASKDAAKRRQGITFLGQQCEQLMLRIVPPKPGERLLAQVAVGVPLASVEKWESLCSALIDRLLAADATTCLTPASQWQRGSMRETAVFFYALTRQGEKMQRVLQQTITYTASPPPGGWRMPDGTPAADAQTPRQMTSPDESETKRVMENVNASLQRYWDVKQPQPKP